MLAVKQSEPMSDGSIVAAPVSGTECENKSSHNSIVASLSGFDPSRRFEQRSCRKTRD